MTAIMQYLPADVSALRQIADLQLSTLIIRDAEIARLSGQLAAIRAAANGDLYPEQDTETLVRQLYHGNEDLKQENAQLRRSLMKDTAHPFTRGSGEVSDADALAWLLATDDRGDEGSTRQINYLTVTCWGWGAWSALWQPRLGRSNWFPTAIEAIAYAIKHDAEERAHPFTRGATD